MSDDQASDQEEFIEAPLPSVVKADPNDATTTYLLDFFENKKFHGKDDSAEETYSDSLEAIDEAEVFEEQYNLRHEGEEEENLNLAEIQEQMTARKRKRAAEKEEKQKRKALLQQKLEEIDAKYEKLVGESGELTPEQKAEYNNETADIILQFNEDKFPYTEKPADGGMEEAIRLLEANDSESDNDHAPPKKSHKAPGKSFNHKKHFDRNPHGPYRGRGRSGRFRGRGGDRGHR